MEIKREAVMLPHTPPPPAPPSPPTSLPKAPIAHAAPSVKYCQKDMDNLYNEAKAGSFGYAPDGKCYSHVADFIDATGFGGIQKGGFNDAISSDYWSQARLFADYLNLGDNAVKLGL